MKCEFNVALQVDNSFFCRTISTGTVGGTLGSPMFHFVSHPTTYIAYTMNKTVTVGLVRMERTSHLAGLDMATLLPTCIHSNCYCRQMIISQDIIESIALKGIDHQWASDATSHNTTGFHGWATLSPYWRSFPFDHSSSWSAWNMAVVFFSWYSFLLSCPSRTDPRP